MDRFDKALRRGAEDREAGKTIRDNPYKSRLHANHWEHAWLAKNDELKFSDFTSLDNPYSLISPKSFFRS